MSTVSSSEGGRESCREEGNRRGTKKGEERDQARMPFLNGISVEYRRPARDQDTVRARDSTNFRRWAAFPSTFGCGCFLRIGPARGRTRRERGKEARDGFFSREETAVRH